MTYNSASVPTFEIKFRNPFTVAIQRSIVQCRGFGTNFNDLRYLCSGCLDRVLLEDY